MPVNFSISFLILLFNDLRHFIPLTYTFITELYKHARNVKYKL
nr:MAG TPA: hypothetical protein [Caudoviricetes sp.]